MFPLLRALVIGALGLCGTVVQADENGCRGEGRPAISFVQFSSPNLLAPSTPLTLKGKLSLPGGGKHGGCGHGWRGKLPAVVILHGSAGVDSRGDFYEEALDAAGIATLQIDMWEARGVTGIANRPAAPILTYPDAFSALAFLANHPRIASGRIGVLGFSWGGVVSLASAEQLYATMFGRGLTFKAHVANYPVCYGANNTSIPVLQPPAQKGTQFLHPTGAPVLTQIGSNDDYDNGAAHCRALARLADPGGTVIRVIEYPGAYHAWDRLMVPVTALDPLADEGSVFRTGVVPPVRIVPDVEQAFASRERVAPSSASAFERPPASTDDVRRPERSQLVQAGAAPGAV